MEEELPYIPNEIVNVIAHFTEGSAGLSFLQTSRTYYQRLIPKKITYFKQHQLDLILQKESIMIEGKQYYGSATGLYCNECSCFLMKQGSIKTHPLKCHRNKPLICEHCESPKPFHKTFQKKTCGFKQFNCGHCKKRYYYFEHDPYNCPGKKTYCDHCNKQFKLKDLPGHDCTFVCHMCNQKIDCKEKYNHSSKCPELITNCRFCRKSYKVNNPESKATHEENCKSKCNYCQKMIHNKSWDYHIANCTIECEKCKQPVHIKQEKIHKYDCREAMIGCELCSSSYKPNNKTSTDKHNQFCRSVCFKCGKFYKYNHVCDPTISRSYDWGADCFCYYKTEYY